MIVDMNGKMECILVILINSLLTLASFKEQALKHMTADDDLVASFYSSVFVDGTKQKPG